MTNGREPDRKFLIVLTYSQKRAGHTRRVAARNHWQFQRYMKRKAITEEARVAIRARPKGVPIMHQSWGKLLFMHWRISEALLRPKVPNDLTIDTFDGSAWIAVAPFTMWDMRPFPPYLPAVPGLSKMHELNVRTYVHHDGIPGVWFFSLDANSAVAVLTARTLFHLPYFNAEMSLEQAKDTVVYSSHRTDERAPAAELDVTWKIGESIPESNPGSQEFFLTERYCLYAAHKQKLYRSRIFHEPWALRTASLGAFSSSMIESHGLPTLDTEPLLHYAEELSVDIWPLEKA